MSRKELHKIIRTLERTERRKQLYTAGATLVVALAALGGVALVTRHPAEPAAAMATTTPAVNAYAGIHLVGEAAIVYDLTTGETLYEQNADAQLPLASLTKLLTMYAAAGTLTNTAPVVITPTAIATEGDSGLREGEVFTFNDLARFALVASSNDAAEAIAEAAEAKRASSASQMLADAASAAGLSETYALNSTGLDESAFESGGYGSARDVALLAGEFLKEAPSIAAATIEPSITVSSEQGIRHTLLNTNQDVVHIPGLLLSKTGYTDLAGGNLAVVFDAGINHPIAAVVLGSTESARFTDVNALVAATLAHFANTPAPSLP